MCTWRGGHRKILTIPAIFLSISKIKGKVPCFPCTAEETLQHSGPLQGENLGVFLPISEGKEGGCLACGRVLPVAELVLNTASFMQSAAHWVPPGKFLEA